MASTMPFDVTWCQREIEGIHPARCENDRRDRAALMQRPDRRGRRGDASGLPQLQLEHWIGSNSIGRHARGAPTRTCFQRHEYIRYAGTSRRSARATSKAFESRKSVRDFMVERVRTFRTRYRTSSAARTSWCRPSLRHSAIRHAAAISGLVSASNRADLVIGRRYGVWLMIAGQARGSRGSARHATNRTEVVPCRALLARWICITLARRRARLGLRRHFFRGDRHVMRLRVGPTRSRAGDNSLSIRNQPGSLGSVQFAT